MSLLRALQEHRVRTLAQLIFDAIQTAFILFELFNLRLDAINLCLQRRNLLPNLSGSLSGCWRRSDQLSLQCVDSRFETSHISTIVAEKIIRHGARQTTDLAQANPAHGISTIDKLQDMPAINCF